jgi:hypothetical protein
LSFDLIGGHNKTPQHLPVGSFSLFGKNPYAECMWRVVWSESRYYLVGANHVTYDESAGGASNDAIVKQRGKDPNQEKVETGYKWLPLYPGRAGWVLELWKSPEGFTGCSPEIYEITYRDHKSGLLTLGPYPQRGEFCHAHFFDKTPSYDEVCKQIQLRRAGWNYTYNDHMAANKESLEKKEKEKMGRFEDIFLDAQQAFKNRPSNIRRGKRTKEQVKLSAPAPKHLKKQGFFSK